MAELLQEIQVEGKVIICNPQAIITQAANLLDLFKDGLQVAPPVAVAEDRARAKIAVKRAPQCGHERSGLGTALTHPFTLVGSVVKIAAVRQRERLDDLFRVVDRWVIGVQPSHLAKQAVVGLHWKLYEAFDDAPCIMGKSRIKVILAESGKAEIGFTSEDDVERPAETFRVQSW